MYNNNILLSGTAFINLDQNTVIGDPRYCKAIGRKRKLSCGTWKWDDDVDRMNTFINALYTNKALFCLYVHVYILINIYKSVSRVFPVNFSGRETRISVTTSSQPGLDVVFVLNSSFLKWHLRVSAIDLHSLKAKINQHSTSSFES